MSVYTRMKLRSRQARLLRRTERALRRSDPDPASMLSIFARLAAAEQLPAQEQLRLDPPLAWVRRVLMWPVAVLALTAGSGTSAAAGSRRGLQARRQ